MATISQQLIAQFRAWEMRGRGWAVYGQPIDLEPDFVPFFYHFPKPQPLIDDGKRHTLFSGLKNSLKNVFAPSGVPDIPVEEEEIKAYPFERDWPLCGVSVVFPKGYKVPVHETEQLLLMLASCEYPVSFEIIATNKKIRIQYTCTTLDAAYLTGQLKAYFPQAVILETEDAMRDMFEGVPEVIDFGLSHEFTRPVAMAGSFDPDPFVGLFGFLDHFNEDEGGGIQILFQGCKNPWAESILRSVTTNEGGTFFEDAPEMVPLAKQKIASPFFGVVLRAIGKSDDIDRSVAIARRIGDALIQFSRTAGNNLIPLSNEEYPFEERFRDVALRQSHRLGMLLNSRELALFVHFPSASIGATKLERDAKKTKAAPAIARGHKMVLGTNMHQGSEIMVSQSTELRTRHTHIIGSTGSGKSTLLLSMIAQDIEQHNGVAVLDPHGDLIEKLLSHIPAHRINDVLLIDPADAECPVGLNILSAHSELEKDILSSDLVAAFRKNSTSWGDQMNSVFANAILAFLESSQGGTLSDLRRFLIEKEYRTAFLKTVQDLTITYYWLKEYPLLKSSSIGSILTRLDSFLRPKLIRNMVSQKKSIDFGGMMDEKKIILMKLSQGLIGEENSYLLGTLIVSKFQQAAMGRQAIKEADRSDFFFYIDECHHFSTPSMATILSGTRKYKLSLIASHQDLNQLQRESELASSLAGAGTRICFRLGDTDAKKLEDGFSFFDAKDLQNLTTGEAIARFEKSEYDFTLTTIPRPPSTIPAEVKEHIIAHSRTTYGTPREEVERMLAESMQIREEEPAKEKRPEPERKKGFAAAENKEDVPPVPKETTSKQQTHGPATKPAEAVPEPIVEIKETSRQNKQEREHRYLQTLIKHMAEDRGYKTTIEEMTPDGKGKVDIGLLRNGKRIACEISVTTGAPWELHNIEKCLAAGYDTVIVCSTDKGNLEKIRKLVQQKLDAAVQARVLTLEPPALFLYLDQQIANEGSTEERVDGFRVKVKYTAVPEDVAKQKRGRITKAVIDSIKSRKK